MCGANPGCPAAIVINPIQFINPKASAQKIACTPQNNQGAKNKNVYSIGSVIPVNNEVKPAEKQIENANLRFSLGAALTIAIAANGRPKIINTYLP